MKNTWKAIILVSIQLVCYIDTSALAENICTHFNPCKNLADCYRRDDDPSRVRCACNRGFNGNLCEIWPRNCRADFCLNGGSCIMIKGIPRCLCQPQFNGIFCENYSFQTVNQPINPSNSSFILNGATQTSNSNNDFGKNVFEATTIASGTPFAPTATNQNPTNSFDYTTRQNEENQNIFVNPFAQQQPTNPPITICAFEPCLNYGNCVALSNSQLKFRCICPENYAGVLCESYVPPITFGTNEREPLEINYASVSYEMNSYPSTFQTSSAITQTTTPTTTTTTMTTTTTTQPTTTTTTESTTTTTTTTSTTTTSTTQITMLDKSQSTEPNFYTEPTTKIDYWSITESTTERPFVRFSICNHLRPCANNGQCVDVTNQENIQKFRCICQPDYTGVFCHIKVARKPNVCAYNLCLNGGECVPVEDGSSFNCNCPPNYTGKYCEINAY